MNAQFYSIRKLTRQNCESHREYVLSGAVIHHGLTYLFSSLTCGLDSPQSLINEDDISTYCGKTTGWEENE